MHVRPLRPRVGCGISTASATETVGEGVRMHAQYIRANFPQLTRSRERSPAMFVLRSEEPRRTRAGLDQPRRSVRVTFRLLRKALRKMPEEEPASAKMKTVRRERSERSRPDRRFSFRSRCGNGGRDKRDRFGPRSKAETAHRVLPRSVSRALTCHLDRSLPGTGILLRVRGRRFRWLPLRHAPIFLVHH